MTTYEQSYFRNRAYLAVSLTHFFVDVLNNSRTLLIAIIAVSIGLTNAEVGIALLLYNIGSSLSQPVFGWLADRFGPRWLVVGGMGWMIGLYSLAAVF
jgi:FSR family fosmidomycin resistance protein-like MFS transporter